MRPSWQKDCFHCQRPRPGTRKAGLRLDTEAGFFASRDKTGPRHREGQPDKSPLYQRLTTKEEDDISLPRKELSVSAKRGSRVFLKSWAGRD